MAQDTILISEATQDGEPNEEVSATPLGLPARYEPGILLGEGGMGQVRLVRDRELDREVAMKIVRMVSPRALNRFRLEAKTQATLQHPNIVPLYDWGQLEDGRIWYTMQVVRGQRFSEIIEALFEPTSLPWGLTESGWTLHRLIQALATVSQAVSYAHSRGVLHRDIKPDNLMVGEFGEVFVLDWGVSRLHHEEPDPAQLGDDEPSGPSGSFTLAGTVIGTPSYMAPEQASGDVDRHSPASDVYALGAVLFELLEGRPPGALPIRNPEAPRELIALSDRALVLDPADRPSASVFADTLSAWLDGSRRKAEAVEVLDLARRAAREPTALRDEARTLRASAEALSEGIETYDPIEKKLPVWSLEEEAEGLESQASLLEGRWEGLIRRALNLDPDLEGAHQDLADWYRGQLERAEARNDKGEAQRCEELVRLHDRGAHTAWLDGKGRVTLRTDPPGATVVIHRYVEQGRRLVPVRLQTVTAPLTELELDRGSYLFMLEAEGCHPVRYPVFLDRLEHWDGVPPGETETRPVYLPRLGELDEDECYVPAGWCWLGDDDGAFDPEPRRKCWLDGYVIQKNPVSNAQFLAFLNDLVSQGKPEQAEACQPLTTETAGARPIFKKRAGRYSLGTLDFMDVEADHPVVCVDHAGAMAYAAWRNAVLPSSSQWEKAGRGVDGRSFPWGDRFDATFARMMKSAPQAGLARVASTGQDISVYGVTDLAGNCREWCSDHFRKHPDAPPLPELYFIRGGAFTSGAKDQLHLSSRYAAGPERRLGMLGFRTARSVRRP